MELLAFIGVISLASIFTGIVLYEIMSHCEFWGGLSRIDKLSERISKLENRDD